MTATDNDAAGTEQVSGEPEKGGRSKCQTEQMSGTVFLAETVPDTCSRLLEEKGRGPDP
jgi:hypothetical protein